MPLAYRFCLPLSVLSTPQQLHRQDRQCPAAINTPASSIAAPIAPAMAAPPAPASFPPFAHAPRRPSSLVFLALQNTDSCLPSSAACAPPSTCHMFSDPASPFPRHRFSRNDALCTSSAFLHKKGGRRFRQPPLGWGAPPVIDPVSVFCSFVPSRPCPCTRGRSTEQDRSAHRSWASRPCPA